MPLRTVGVGDIYVFVLFVQLSIHLSIFATQYLLT